MIVIINVTAAVLGNLGGGITQILMTSEPFNPAVHSSISADTAWRISIIVTAAVFLITVTGLKRLYWDAPTANVSTWHVRSEQNQEAILDYTALLLLVLTRSRREQPVGHAFQDLIGST